MKIIVFLILLSFLFVTNSFSQSAEKDKYVNKASNQNTCGWILAFGGTALHIVGIAMESSIPILDFNATPEEQQSRKRKENTAEILFITGGAALVGCIPLFISSHINHKRSLRVAINMKPFNQLKANNMYASSYPALSLKIGL